MNVYAYGYWYVCDPLLHPVVDRLRWFSHDVTYHNLWISQRDDSRHWQAWLDNDQPDRVLLLACDILTGAHQRGVNRVRQCRERGIPAVSIQHGAPPPDGVKPTADTVCIWGDGWREWIRHDDMVATGNPALDAKPQREYAHFRIRQRGMPVPYALFAGSLRNHYSNPDLFREVITAVAQRIPVVMERHPNPAESQHWQFFEDMAALDNVTVWPPDARVGWLRLLRAGADLVFGRSSVLVEAAIQGVPALVASDHDDPRVDGVVYHRYTSPADIDTALNSRGYADFVREWGTATFGAAERVVDVMSKRVKAARREVIA